MNKWGHKHINTRVSNFCRVFFNDRRYLDIFSFGWVYIYVLFQAKNTKLIHTLCWIITSIMNACASLLDTLKITTVMIFRDQRESERWGIKPPVQSAITGGNRGNFLFFFFSFFFFLSFSVLFLGYFPFLALSSPISKYRSSILLLHFKGLSLFHSNITTALIILLLCWISVHGLLKETYICSFDQSLLVKESSVQVSFCTKITDHRACLEEWRRKGKKSKRKRKRKSGEIYVQRYVMWCCIWLTGFKFILIWTGI